MTYLTGALHVHHLWYHKHQHENRVRSKLFVACQDVAFSLLFAASLVNCAPSGEMHNYCTPHIIKENFENFLIHPCNYILLSQVYCVWQVVKTPTFILNNPALASSCLPVRPSIRMERKSALTGRIFMKFDIWTFSEKLSRKFKFSLKSDKNNGYFTWRPIYVCVCDHISLNSNEKCFTQNL